MKYPKDFVTECLTLHTNSKFIIQSRTYAKEHIVAIIYQLLMNKKDYDFDEGKILILANRLKSLGYKVTTDVIYLDITQSDLDYITSCSDDYIQEYADTIYN